MRNSFSKLVTFFCMVMFVVLVSACGGPSSSPTQTLTAYCSALKSANYQAAYNQFVTGSPAGISESQYAAVFKAYGNVTNCSPANVNDSAGTGSVHMTFSNLGDVMYDSTLVNDNGTWKIKAIIARYTLTFVLNLYCLALVNADYQSAYKKAWSAG